MCIKFPFPIISTLSQYPEFKLNINHLRPGEISISHRATTPHATISTHPPKTTTFLSSLPLDIFFSISFFITPLCSTNPALFFLSQESSLSSTPCYFSFDSSVLFADDRHRETSSGGIS